MKLIRHTATLVYYDGPLVFEARDPIGGCYIATIAESKEQYDYYLVKGVTPEQLRQFHIGVLDLRSLMLDPDVVEWYLTKTDDLNQPLELVQQSTPIAGNDFLPSEGFMLHDTPTDNAVLNEARKRNDCVLEIAVDPPEATEDHRIRVNTLAGLLNNFENMVKRASFAQDRMSSYRLDVLVPAMAGSFKVFLAGANVVGETVQKSLFPPIELGSRLKIIDDLFANTDDADKSVAIVKKYQGHLAGAYLNLLKFLISKNTGLSFSWAEPKSTSPSHRSISVANAKLLFTTLSTVTDISTEKVTLVGDFEKMNRGSGAWGLKTADGISSGKIGENGPPLDGLIVGNCYKFYCNEEIKQVDITGKEERELYLIEYEVA